MFHRLSLKQIGLFVLVIGLVYLLSPLLVQRPIKSKIGAVIFNCDGILVDNEHTHFLAWQKVLAHHNIPFTFNEYMHLTGSNPQEFISHISSTRKINLPKEEMIHEKNQIYRILLEHGIPHNHSGITLARILENNRNQFNIKLALASPSSREEILLYLKSTGLENMFDVIVSGKDDLAHITDPREHDTLKPYIYQRVSELLQIPPQNCLVIEESARGIDSAIAAGMTVIGVPNQFTRQQDFSKAHEIYSNILQFDFKHYFGKLPDL